MKKKDYISRDMILEAKKNPGGYVYKIDTSYNTDDDIPPEAIVGAWKVDIEGNIIENSFMENPNYIPFNE